METLKEARVTYFQSKKEDTVANDFQASTEYIDSIRKSSETVFARTEALANKNTSFKVMRTRFQ